MTATNHALTGAVIGLAISQPAIALPLAFLSHFALDAMPHWQPIKDERRWLSSIYFKVLLILEASLCFLLVVFLAVIQPRHWLIAAFCAFLAASPDLFWLKKFLVVKKTDKLLPNHNWFWHFHAVIQWFSRPIGGFVELAWLAAMLVFVGILA